MLFQAKPVIMYQITGLVKLFLVFYGDTCESAQVTAPEALAPLG